MLGVEQATRLNIYNIYIVIVIVIVMDTALSTISCCLTWVQVVCAALSVLLLDVSAGGLLLEFLSAASMFSRRDTSCTHRP
jgi:hypothetical protein